MNKQMMAKMGARFLGASALFLGLSGGFAQADDFDLNGSFEEEAPIGSSVVMTQYQSQFEEKGFAFKFDTNRWARAWIVNGITDPAAISFAEGEGIPDGQRALKIETTGVTHVFTENALPAGVPYKCTFWAKGESVAQAPPKIAIFAYLDSHQKWIKNVEVTVIDLNEEWKEYSFEVPASFEGAVTAEDDVTSLRIAFGFSGKCEFDKFAIGMETL